MTLVIEVVSPLQKRILAGDALQSLQTTCVKHDLCRNLSVASCIDYNIHVLEILDVQM